MLYYLYELFHINLFQYITFRAGIAFFMSFILTLYFLPKFIEYLKNKEANQPIYELAPEAHRKKSTTPTMGGVVFIMVTILASLVTMRYDSVYAIGAVITLILFMAIGVKDDYDKISNNDNQSGLSSRGKMILQIGASIIVGLFLYFNNFPTNFYIPMYKFPLYDMHIFAVIFWIFVFVATSNAVNLTDGLDGLATVPSIFSIMTLGVFAYAIGNAIISKYLLLPHVQGVGEVVIVGSALLGALVGFLWFNAHPAEIFMGDSGSLAIGGFIAYMAIVTKNELLLVLVGFVFVMETVSVILQVGSYKTRKKRIFMMAPIHHHFEIKGWAENKIIVRFWIMAAISNIIALITLKLR
jgi:phospho-N-acetylmuramoyl-pentapeptide-transferase